MLCVVVVVIEGCEFQREVGGEVAKLNWQERRGVDAPRAFLAIGKLGTNVARAHSISNSNLSPSLPFFFFMNNAKQQH